MLACVCVCVCVGACVGACVIIDHFHDTVDCSNDDINIYCTCICMYMYMCFIDLYGDRLN